jgi:hypothetical protein
VRRKEKEKKCFLFFFFSSSFVVFRRSADASLSLSLLVLVSSSVSPSSLISFLNPHTDALNFCEFRNSAFFALRRSDNVEKKMTMMMNSTQQFYPDWPWGCESNFLCKVYRRQRERERDTNRQL